MQLACYFQKSDKLRNLESSFKDIDNVIINNGFTPIFLSHMQKNEQLLLNNILFSGLSVVGDLCAGLL